MVSFYTVPDAQWVYIQMEVIHFSLGKLPTLTVHVPAVLSTVAVYVWPLITTVTTVFAASAGTFFNTPVTVTLPDASDALITLSAVTESTV